MPSLQNTWVVNNINSLYDISFQPDYVCIKTYPDNKGNYDAYV